MMSPQDVEIARMQHAEGYGGIAKAVAVLGVAGLVFSGGAALSGAGDLVMLPFQLLGDIAGGIGDMISTVIDGVHSVSIGSAEGASSMIGSIVWLFALVVKVGLIALAVVIAAAAARWLFDYYVAYQRSQTLHNLEFARQRLGIQKMELDLVLVLPDERGNLPVARGLLESGAVTSDIFQLLHDKVLNGRPLPLPQPVPTSIHYAPVSHYTGHHAPTAALMEPQALPTMQPALNFLELFDAGKLPTNKFLMGFDVATGEAVTADWKDLYSALIGGASGSGKSTLIRSVLAQSALQNGRFIVLDPHYGSGEESLGESLKPLQSRMLAPVAATEAQMLDSLHYVRDVGVRRLAGADKDRTPVILIVDETTALLSRSNIAQELNGILAAISQETRKVAIYSMCIGQNFKGTIMDTETRNSFVSMLSCRSRKDNARVMSGNSEFAEIAENLRIGEAVWMTPGGDVIKIAVPNTTADMVEVVAKKVDSTAQTQAQPLLVVDPLQKPLQTPLREGTEWIVGEVGNEVGTLTAKQQNAVEMFKSGATKTQIIAEVWGVSGGAAFQAASTEFDNALRSLIGGTK